METGFNIVEVPGSESRKVAGEKQQWYRTAISEMFFKYYNLLLFSTFHKNVTAKFDVLDSKRISNRFIQPNKGYNLISPTDFIFKSVFSFKLQKTVRLFFSGNLALLVKSYFSIINDLWKTDFYSFVIPGMESDKFKNR